MGRWVPPLVFYPGCPMIGSLLSVRCVGYFPVAFAAEAADVAGGAAARDRRTAVRHAGGGAGAQVGQQKAVAQGEWAIIPRCPALMSDA